MKTNLRSRGADRKSAVRRRASMRLIERCRSWVNGLERLENRCLLSGDLVPLGGEFRVNAPNLDGMASDVAMDAAGNSVVTWTTYSADDNHAGVVARRYDAAGSPQGGEFHVNTFTAGDQGSGTGYGKRPSVVAMDHAGNFVIAWTSNGQDGSGRGIYAQRYNSLGVRQGDEFRVNTFTAGDQDRPDVAMDALGNFLIVWESNGQDGAGLGTYGQRYNAAGVAQGTEFRVNTGTAGDQGEPVVAMSDSGAFVVGWHYLLNSGTPAAHWGVAAQRYNAAGVAQGGEFEVSQTHLVDSQGVAMDAAGNFVFVGDGDDGSSGGVYARRYSATGVALGDEFRVNTTTAESQQDPAVAMTGGGDVLISWTSYDQDGDAGGIFAQAYDSLGAPRGVEFQVNTYTAQHQWACAVSADDLGHFIITWDSFGQDGIYARRWGAASAAPEFGAIPAAVNMEEPRYYHASSWPWGTGWIEISATDADTPPAGLTYSVDSATPGGWGSPYFCNWNPYVSGWCLAVPLGDGPYQQTIDIRVTDNIGLSDTATIVVNVANVAPNPMQGYGLQLNPFPGEAAYLSVMSTDIDPQEAWWDFGDGVVTPPQTMEFRPGHFDTHYFASASHVYPAQGNYTATAYVRDDDGAVSTLKFNVTVAQYRLDYDGTLRVYGLPGNDTINVSPAAGGKVNLFIGGALKGVFAANSVVAWGNGGDDTLDAAESLNVPVEYHGGPGNDLLRGGMGNDALFGEEGNDRIEGRSGHDILVGGIGNDRLRGVAGRDLLLGGAGFDSLYGDADDDILIAGPTAYDADLAALSKIRDEWVSVRPYAVRIDNIRDGTGSADRVNGSYFFKGGSTAFDDGTEDWLCGVGGDDWFLADTATGDKLMDRLPGEEVDVI